MTLLSVNVNKIAVLRNSRGDDLPSVVQAAEVCIEAGCGGITVHPRPDQRHIRPGDVHDLAALLKGTTIEFNIEGNPFAPARGDYPGLIELVRATRPAQATLVPDADGQITSDHGFDLRRDSERLRPLIAELKQLGCRVSLFIDADAQEVERATELGADRLEIYTGPYAKAFAAGDAQASLQQCRDLVDRAARAGLGLNAGHDLNQLNLGPFLQALPEIAEVSIGHALIGEAVYDGLALTVQRYLKVIQDARKAAA